MIQEMDKTLFLGIDLGTSRTTIMSSRGGKGLVRSVVGYPKDILGVKLLNRTFAVGDEALAKKSYMDLHFPLEDGVLKETGEQNTQAARELLKHAIGLVSPAPGDRICGILGVPARASVTNKGQLLKIADEVMDLSMVVSEPFMVAYGLNRLTNAIIIDIGAGTTDLCAMKGTIPLPEEQVTLLKAGSYIDDILAAAITEAHPEVQMTNLLAKKLKERFSHVGPGPQEVAMVELRSGGKPRNYDIGREVRFACETVVPDILESLEQLVSVFDPEDQADAVKNIILAGGGSAIRGLDQVLKDGLKSFGEVHVFKVDEPDYAGAAGALKLATELPPDYWTQVGDVIGE
ncbi:MAG: hypothetical protein HW380_1214 [Magnetococcales bacterium]|nr:hypothetical protein [Magnetococcales bacterium]HIJ83868.1 hypothetical protein [Magnetococcales bacterium]